MSHKWSGVLIILISALFLLALAGAVTAQTPQPTLAPTNPAFADYFQRKSMGLLQGTAEEGYPLGLIPPPVDLSHIESPRTLQGPELLSLPAAYDLRTLGKLTAIRNQGGCGSCWAFAAYGSLESNLMPGELRNFSENNLKNLAGFDIPCCDGGNEYMTSAYLGRWNGPVDETDDPYNAGSCTSPPGLEPEKHIQNVDFIPDRTGPTDNDLIKQAVMTYGAVYTSFYWDGSYYNSTYYAYYFSGTPPYNNHAVCIVGWDDNFDRTKFNTIPAGNGAFIVRNSWGTSWGQGGYFYASYYDTSFGKENAVFWGVEPTTDYAHNYQYDPLGWVSSAGYGSNTAWFANVFIASDDEVLSAVSFYAASPDSSYEIRVYLNPTSGPINPSGPMFTQTGTVTSGYQTIPISGPFLTAGCTFSAVVKLTTPGFDYPIPIEAPYSGYSSGATASAGQSYISSSGSSWVDITNYYSNANCCLKAFTTVTSGISVTPSADLASTGPVGGPFSPASQIYTISNSGALTIDWTASKTQPWVSLSSTGGSLGPGGSTTVTVSYNAEAESLAAGDYSDVVSFVNATSGQGNTTRNVSLTIKDPCLDVIPADGLASCGETGGPFSPTAKVYTITNSGYGSLSWTVAKSQSWVSLSSTGGVLAPGASTDITVSLGSAAEELPLGEYSDTVSFTNVTNGDGNTTRNVALAIANNYFIEPATSEWIDGECDPLEIINDEVAPFALPFAFEFYGQPYSTIYVGENGLLGFNDSLTAAENTGLPTTAAPNNAIYPFWDDLDAWTYGGYICAFTTGEAPNRKVVITWMGPTHAGSYDPLAFQALLCEGSNDIIFQYFEIQPQIPGYGGGRSATIGVENAQGTVARVYSVNGSTLLNNGDAFRFTFNRGDISDLKQLPDETPVSIYRAIISCAFTDQFYIESDDRSCGLMVEKLDHGFLAGMRVDVKGIIDTNDDGERYIKNATVTGNGKGTVDPLAVINRWLGGADNDYNPGSGAGQCGVKNGSGPNNIGLLVGITGRVTHVEAPYFYVDDGSGLDDGSGHGGVKVDGTEITLPNLDSFVRLFGASSCWKNGSDVQRLVKAPDQVIVEY